MIIYFVLEDTSTSSEMIIYFVLEDTSTLSEIIIIHLAIFTHFRTTLLLVRNCPTPPHKNVHT